MIWADFLLPSPVVQPFCQRKSTLSHILFTYKKFQSFSHPLLVLESYRTRFSRAEGASDDPELAVLAQMVESQCKVSGGGNKLPTTNLSVRGGLRISTTALAPPSSNASLAMTSGSSSSAYATAAACNHSSSVTETYHVDPEQSGKLLVLFRMMQARLLVIFSVLLCGALIYRTLNDFVQSNYSQQSSSSLEAVYKYFFFSLHPLCSLPCYILPYSTVPHSTL